MDTLKSHAPKQLYYVSIEKQPLPKTKSFLGIEYDTLTLIASFTIPIFSFFLGFLFSTLKNRIIEIRTTNIASDFFLMWLKRSVKAANKLLQELNKKVDSVKTLDGFEFSKPPFINLSLARILNDQNSLYKAFVTAKKGDIKQNFEDYSKIIINTEFLGDFQQMLMQNSQYIVDEFNMLFLNWNDAIQQLHKAKHILVGKRSDEKTDKIKDINVLFNKWYEYKESNLSKTIEFLNELEPVLQKYYNLDPTDDDLADLLSVVQKVNVIYRQFVAKRDDVVRLFNDASVQLEESINEIESLGDKIANKKNRIFYL